MKTLKHIGGILLATVGVMFVLGAITAAFDRDPEMLWWMVAIMFVVLGLLPLAGAVVLLRRRATELPSAHCPQCGGTERAPAGVLTRSHNPWLYHFGGWLFASLWGASRQQQVRCLHCDSLYLTETKGTRIAGICLWVFMLLLLLSTIASYFEKR
jgi:hypothetical protein